MPGNQKGFAHFVVLILLLIGLGVGIYLVQHPTFFKPHASELPAASTINQTTPTLAFVFAGESNAVGLGLNSEATPDEVAKTSSVQILNNYSFTFQDLAYHILADPSTNDASNNTLDDAVLPDHPGDHGFELQLTKSVKAGAFPNTSQVYLVKTGQGGASVASWLPEAPVNPGASLNYWGKFIQRITAAKSFLYQPGKPVQWVVWYSLGINDLVTNPPNRPTPVADFKAKSTTIIHNIKGQLPGAIIVLTQFQSQSSSQYNFTEYNNALSEIAAAESNVYVVDSTGAPVNDPVTDPKHWSYAGLKIVGSRMVDITKNALSTVNTISASPDPCTLSASGLCTSRVSWNFPTVPDLKITVRENPGSTISYQIPTGSVDVNWISANGANFDAYSGNYLVGSVFVKGTDYTARNPTSTGQISATPCVVTPGNTSCSSTINWSTNGTVNPVKVKVRETSGLFALGTSGSQVAPWVSTTPVHLDLIEGDDTVLASVFVQATPILTASPNPCVLNAAQICTVKISWNSSYADLKITIKEAPNSLFATGASGSQDASWIGASGATFQAYSGGTLVDSLLVSGVSSAASPQSSASVSISPSPSPQNAKIADFDHDGDIDFDDFGLFRQYFQSKDFKADLNQDNKVDFFDFSVMLGKIGG